MNVYTDFRAEGMVRVITLDDPKKLNAIGKELRVGLDQEVAKAVSDPGCRIIVLTGANGAFSSGGELSSIPTDSDAIRQRMGTLQGTLRNLVQCPQIVIAAVDGAAYGSGMSLAALADVVLASDGARFGCTFGRVGLIPDLGLMWSVPRRIGLRRTRQMVLKNMVVEADDALCWGLADVGCRPGTALDCVIETAAEIIKTPAVTLAHAKRMFSQGMPGLDEVLEDELLSQVEMFGTEHFASARQKFLNADCTEQCNEKGGRRVSAFVGVTCDEIAREKAENTNLVCLSDS